MYFCERKKKLVLVVSVDPCCFCKFTLQVCKFHSGYSYGFVMKLVDIRANAVTSNMKIILECLGWEK